MNDPVELIETAEIAGGPCVRHPVYNPDPDHHACTVDRQAPGRDEQIGQRRLFRDGLPVPQ
jgi:hypothetical protein